MVAPKLLLAHRWQNDIDISGWWMSEKLDGVRAYWDGKQLISRLGNPICAPDWFVAGLPPIAMDGELFGGRGQFQTTVSIVRRIDPGPEWRTLRYQVFDAPGVCAGFEDRLTALKDAVDRAGAAHLAASDHRTVASAADLAAELVRVEALGAEGLMLRQPGSPYEAGRSWTLLKVKSFFDAEARVTAHLEGTGKHMGRLGALMVELPSGVGFKIGTGFTDAQRDAPPAVGAIVSFRYQELTDAGVPRFPSFLGERIDLSFEELTDPPRRASPTTGAPARLRRLGVPPLPSVPPVIVPGAAPVPAPPPAPAPPPDLDPSGTVYLEFTKGRTLRFWEIAWEGGTVHTSYGRVDHPPHHQTETFEDPVDAARFVVRQIAAKREKGYVDEV